MLHSLLEHKNQVESVSKTKSGYVKRAKGALEKMTPARVRRASKATHENTLRAIQVELKRIQQLNEQSNFPSFVTFLLCRLTLITSKSETHGSPPKTRSPPSTPLPGSRFPHQAAHTNQGATTHQSHPGGPPPLLARHVRRHCTSSLWSGPRTSRGVRHRRSGRKTLCCW